VLDSPGAWPANGRCRDSRRGAAPTTELAAFTGIKGAVIPHPLFHCSDVNPMENTTVDRTEPVVIVADPVPARGAKVVPKEGADVTSREVDGRDGAPSPSAEMGEPRPTEVPASGSTDVADEPERVPFGPVEAPETDPSTPAIPSTPTATLPGFVPTEKRALVAAE